MKKVLLLAVLLLLGSANMFAMEKLSPAVKNKLTQVAGQGQVKFEAYVKANAIPVTWSEYQTFLAKPATGEAVAQFPGEEAPLKTTLAVTPPKPIPAPKKGVVITEAQIAALDKDATSMANIYFNLQSRIESLALSTGTQEDAREFMDAMRKRHEEIFNKIDQNRKKPDFSSLPHKEKSPLTKDEKEAYKAELQAKFNDLGNVQGFDQEWALRFINRELDADYKEHDDTYFKEVIKSQGWKEK